MSKLNGAIESLAAALARTARRLPRFAQYDGYVGAYAEFHRHDHAQSGVRRTKMADIPAARRRAAEFDSYVSLRTARQ